MKATPEVLVSAALARTRYRVVSRPLPSISISNSTGMPSMPSLFLHSPAVKMRYFIVADDSLKVAEEPGAG